MRIHCETDIPAPLRRRRQTNPQMKKPGSIEHLTLRAQPITSYHSDSERSCHERPGQQIATAAIATDHCSSHCHWSGSAMYSIQQNWLQTTSSSACPKQSATNLSHAAACASEPFFCDADQSKGTDHTIHRDCQPYDHDRCAERLELSHEQGTERVRSEHSLALL